LTCSTRDDHVPEERGHQDLQQPVSEFDPDSVAYIELFESVKSRIRASRIRAALSVNCELIALYWQIGHLVVDVQSGAGWGASVIERLSCDLRKSFPEIRGLSTRNLWRMRSFYLAYPSTRTSLPRDVADLVSESLPQSVAEIPWGHNAVLVEKVKEPKIRIWYAEQTIEHGWSRAVLVHQIESRLFDLSNRSSRGGRKVA